MEDPSENKPHLSTLEQISPQAYVRTILCFEIPSNTPHQEVTRILRQSLEATAAEIPTLKCLVISVTDPDGKKRMDLRQTDAAFFTIKDPTSSDLNYDNIRSEGYPSHAFDGETLCATGVFAAPGSPVPTFLAQANFISGGLLLGLSIWHGALDGTAITTILKLWAQNCRILQNPGDSSLDTFTLPASAFDKSPLSKPSSATAAKLGTLSNHPEFILLPEAPTSLPPCLALALKTRIFHLSPSSIAALKALVSPRNATSAQTTEYSWTSTNTAISALVWRSVIAAVYAHERPPPDSLSIFASLLNVRKRFHPPLSPHLIASAFVFQESRMAIPLLLESRLADIALLIRVSTDKIDANYIDSLIAMIDGVSGPAAQLLLPLSFTDVLRSCAILTSWVGFGGMYGFDWGGALGGRCERVRTVEGGMFNGMQVLLPELPVEMGGGVEVVVGLEEDAMERLKGDSLWREFARLV